MALTAAQTVSVYHACGLWAGGTTRYRYRFDAYDVNSISDSSLSWDYSAIKTALDTRLAALSAAEVTWLGTPIATYDAALTSSFKMGGEVQLDDSEELRLSKAAIVQVVGLEVEAVKFVDDLNGGGRAGRVVR